MIENYGGAKGTLYSATLDYIVYEINKNNDVYRNAALVVHKIVTGHPFMDGNKRTALGIAHIYLESKGLYITASKKDKLELLLKTASYKVNQKEIEKWLQENTRKL